jgi:hypothetical protein
MLVFSESVGARGGNRTTCHERAPAPPPGRRFELNKIVAMVILILGLGALTWWVLKDRAEEKSETGEAMLRSMERGRVEQVRGDFRTIHLGLTSYMTANGEYPVVTEMRELSPLLSPYVARLDVTDPWGTPYRYDSGGQSYTLSSAGQDRKFGTEDDVVSRDGQWEGPKNLRPINL